MQFCDKDVNLFNLGIRSFLIRASGTNLKTLRKDASNSCHRINARLPLPRDDQETSDLQHIIRDLGMGEISPTNGIVLDIDYAKDKGQVRTSFCFLFAGVCS